MTSMPRPPRSGQNPDDALREEVVLGVDTHKDLHVAAVITGIGGLLGCQSFPATAAGYRQLLDWALGFGPVNRAGVECTGSYGAALARHLRQAGVAVAEVNQPDKATRRRAVRLMRSTRKPRRERCCRARPAPCPSPATATPRR